MLIVLLGNADMLCGNGNIPTLTNEFGLCTVKHVYAGVWLPSGAFVTFEKGQPPENALGNDEYYVWRHLRMTGESKNFGLVNQR